MPPDVSKANDSGFLMLKITWFAEQKKQPNKNAFITPAI